MTDQTQRLEIATVKAEIGSNILSRFSNDAIDAGAIPTESGDIKNLKLIIKEVEDKASVSTSIYPDVTEGLAATEEGGMFLVQSAEDDEIYVVWRKVAGIAVDTGKRALSSQAIETAADAAQASATASADSASAAQVAATEAAALLSDLENISDPMLGAAKVGRAIRHINSLTELRALVGQYDGEVVYLRGRSATDTLGCGHMVWISGSSLVDNDGTIFGSDAAGRWIRPGTDNNVDAAWFGVGNSGADYTTQLEAAIAYAYAPSGGGQGMAVMCPRGVIGISRKVVIPNRVYLQGAANRGTIFRLVGSFVDEYMFQGTEGTSSMFASGIRDAHLDARGYNLTSVVHSTAWQEQCGLQRVSIQYNGTTRNGLYYTNGYGGAAMLPLSDLEIFSDSTNPTNDPIRVDQISSVGAFVVSLQGRCTLAGSVANPLIRGINMVNDTLIFDTLHVEYCNIAVLSQGVGNIDGRVLTGSSNAVIDLILVGSAHTGKVNVTTLMPNGATGSSFRSAATGEDILASEGVVTHFVYPKPAFNATVSAQIPNVTGNGTEYTVAYNTERFDLSKSFSAGIFTAPEKGKYQLSAQVKLTVPATGTTVVVKIVTTAKEYIVFRGSAASIRDGSGTITVGGSVLADLARNATAKVNIIVSGVGSNTVSVEATETSFSGHKAAW